MGSTGASTIQIPVQFVQAGNAAQDFVKSMQSAIKGANLGTDLRDSLTKDLTQVENKLGNVFKKISKQQINMTDLKQLNADLSEIQRLSAHIQDSWKTADFKDLNLSSDLAKNFQNLVNEITTAANKLTSFKEELTGIKGTKVGELLKGEKGSALSAALGKTGKKVDPNKNAFAEQNRLAKQAATDQAKYDSEIEELNRLTEARKNATQALEDFENKRKAQASAKKMLAVDTTIREGLVKHQTGTEILKGMLPDGANSNKRQIAANKEKIVDFFQLYYGISKKEAEAQLASDWSQLEANVQALEAKKGYQPGNTKTASGYEKQSIRTGLITQANSDVNAITNSGGKSYKAQQEHLQEQVAKAEAAVAEKQPSVDSARANAEVSNAAYAAMQAALAEQSKRIAELEAQIASGGKDITEKQNQLKDNMGAEMNSSGNRVRESIDTAKAGTSTFMDQLSKSQQIDNVTSSVGNLAQRFVGFNAILNRCSQVVRTAWNDIKQLDATMANIAVVTNMTTEQLWAQIDAYSQVAKQYGVTTQGVYQVAQIYYQQGLSNAQVNELTTETLKMARIAGMGYQDAANGMTVALRAFNMEMSQANLVTDVYSKVASMSASSSQELIEAMSKTASGAANVGSSFENTTAMIATMVEATRESAVNIGSALKSIIAR